jgi:hypothetical protein
MSEAELHVLRARLQGGILNKARRAALKLHLPIGFCYTEDDRIILDPDRQVQDTIKLLFRTFRQTGTACATVRAFRQAQVAYPRRLRSGPHQGELVWGDMRHDDVLRMLHNPCYAGAFVFGRTRTTKTMDGKIHIEHLPREHWQVVVREAHVGYITWEEFEAHLAQLMVNSQAYTPKRLNPPREGPALLQGLVICGRCGERMTVRYHQRGGLRIVPDYVCQRAAVNRGAPVCQRFLGRDLDATIAQLLQDVVTPEAIAMSLTIQDELVAQADAAERLRQLNVQRAQYEADLAQRRYNRVDPANRLVADVLETEWNAKLRALAEAQKNAEAQRQLDQLRLSDSEREALQAIPSDFVRFWHDPQTTDRDRKRLVRLMIEDVTVDYSDQIVAHIRFKGGATQTLTVPKPIPLIQLRQTRPETLAVLDRLLDSCTDAQAAAQLNAQGLRTVVGLVFQTSHVSQLRRHYGLKDRFTRLREAGLLTAKEVADRMAVRPHTIWLWYRRGWIEGHPYNDRGSCLFVLPKAVPTGSRRRHNRVSAKSL